MTQKSILCYGDSNTWGYIPNAQHSNFKKRFPRHERWTGILQQQLGEQYYIIEEGLNSRTTNLDYAIPPDRNGKTYLPPCLYSHAPIDLVILALGGNDLKNCFNRSAEEIKAGLSDLVDITLSSAYGPELQNPPKILIVPPAIPLEFTENYLDDSGKIFLKGAVNKAHQLVQLYEQLANEKSCYYIDMSDDTKPSMIDGIHYAKETQKIIANILAKEITRIFKNT